VSGGKRNAQRLQKRALEQRGAVVMNRAERRSAAKNIARRAAPDHAAGELKGRKASGGEIRDARRELAIAMKTREDQLAETRAQIVDPDTGKTVDEEKKSRLWRPRVWLPRRRSG